MPTPLSRPTAARSGSRIEPAFAWFGGRLATGLVDVTDDVAALDGAGWWAVVLGFEGEVACARFSDVRETALPRGPWPGIPRASWSSSMSRPQYLAGVASIRDGIAAGDYYQVNLCRVLSAPLPAEARMAGLPGLLAEGNPAPYAGMVQVPDADVAVVTASPELFLR
ncbi:MAG: chorismate-binding protein, partial [Actinomycetes bacterium]